jgi:hypothetical protein
MGHVMLSHHVKNIFILQLKCHSNVTTLEKGKPHQHQNKSASWLFFLESNPLAT